jgi:transposase-like protein
MNVLEDVLTIREIAQRWGLHPTTVRRAIDARRFALMARKSPDDSRGTWLIARASVERRWGKPRA